MFWLVLRRELRLARRQGNELVNPLWFFLIVITLFPLGIGPEPALLRLSRRGSFGWRPYWPVCSLLSGCFVMMFRTAHWINCCCCRRRCRSRC